MSFDSFKNLISIPKPTPIESLLNKYNSFDENIELTRIKQKRFDKVINLRP